MMISSNRNGCDDTKSRQISDSEKYVRVRSAPPQEHKEKKASGSPPFKLCNADGSPLTISLDESSSEETESTNDTASDNNASGNTLEKNLVENIKSITIESIDDAMNEEISNKNTLRCETPSPAVSSPHESPELQLSKQEDSADADMPSEFERFLQIEELMQEFPAIEEVPIKARIGQMLSSRERTPIGFSLILKKKENLSAVNEKLKILKDKKDTSLEKVRNEFNRVTDLNINEVIDNLLATKVEYVDDMKEIAAFVFEKAISEPLYLRIYSQIVGRLKKVWKTTEEQSMTDKSQTCFFGMIVKYLVQRITAKHGWCTQVEVSAIKAQNRADLETQLEDLETARLTKKKQALGAVNFLINLYDLNVIGPTNIMMVVNTLTTMQSAEHVEMLCLILKSLGMKLVSNSRVDLVEKIIAYLETNRKKHGVRIEFLTDQVLKSAAAYTKGAKSPQNAFARLLDDEESGEQKKSEAEEIQEYIFGVSKRLSKEHEEEDFLEVAESIKAFVETHSNTEFFTAYFIEYLSKYGTDNAMLDLYIKHLSEVATDLPGCLRTLREEIRILAIDFPNALTRYTELICYLRGAELIEARDFEQLKTSEFTKKSEQLCKSWSTAGDARFGIVFKGMQ